MNTNIFNNLSDTGRNVLLMKQNKYNIGGILPSPSDIGSYKYNNKYNIISIITVILIIYLFISCKNKTINKESQKSEEFIDMDKIKMNINSTTDNLKTIYDKYTDNIKYKHNENNTPEDNKDQLIILETNDEGVKPFETESRVELKLNTTYEPKIKGFKSNMDQDLLEEL